MLRRYAAVVLLSILALSPNAVFAQQPAQSAPAASTTPSNDPIDRIKDEGMNRSQVMKTLSYLTDVIGPRLTASPNMKRANEWTRAELTKWGLQNAHLEPWGPFGRGWSLKRFSAQVTEPQSIPLIAYPKAWSPGTNGVITADVVYLNAKDDAGLEQFKGKLKGAIVLTSPMREVKAHFEAMGTRRDEKDLLNLADAPEPRGVQRRNFQLSPEQRAAMQFSAKKYQFLLDEGAALAIDPSRIGDGGTIFVGAATVPQPVPTEPFGPNSRGISAYDKRAPKLSPQVVMAVEHYNRLVRMIEAGEKVKMSVELAVEFQDADLMGYNTIAEIPGTDLKDEIVMLGGHMDSWHSGTGATDNGAGVSVGMEAMRIIQALGLKPRRTIRIALWSGEEQGLQGSRAYVAEHFGKMEVPAAPAGAGNGPTQPVRTPGTSKPKHKRKAGSVPATPAQAEASLYPTWLLHTPLLLALQNNRPLYQGPLVLLAGPQRLEAAWWDVAGVSGEHARAGKPLAVLRDYFLARSAQAGLLWIYRERLTAREQGAEANAGKAAASRWYLHGLFA